MTESEEFDRIASTIKTGITNRQIARLAGVPIETVFAYKRKTRGAHNPAAKVAMIQKSEERSLERAVKAIIRIADPRERREAMYGQALLEFEKRQAALGLRPELPLTL